MANDQFQVTTKLSVPQANMIIDALQLLSGYEAFNSKAVAATGAERQAATMRYREVEVLLAKFGAKPTPEVQRRFADPGKTT